MQNKKSTSGSRSLEALRIRTAELQSANEQLRQEIAARSKAEADLLLANQEWLDTFNATSDPIMLLDTDHQVRRVNQAMADLVGLPVEEVTGKFCHELVHDSNAPIALCPQSKLLQDGLPHSEEVYIEKLDRTYLVSVSPIFGPAQRLVGSVHYVKDISELKKLNETLEARVQERTLELHTSEQLYQLATSVAKEAIWEVDLATGVTRWNRAYTEMFGRPGNEHHHGKWWLWQIHPDDRERVGASFDKALLQGPDLWVCDYRMKRPDGGYLFISDRATIVRSASGAPLRVVGAKLDVTDRKLAEKALHQSEDRFRVLADSMPGLVWTARPDGLVDYWNRFALDYAGIEQIGSASMWQIDYVHPDDREATRQVWQNAILSGLTYQREHRLRRRDGAYRWHLSRGVPLRDETGEIVKWYGTTIDIHDLREAQHKINSMAMQLALAEEGERCRIAGELHDQVGPTLLLSRMKVNALASLIPPEAGEGAIEAIDALLLQAVKEVRTLTFQLRPPVLANAGLEAALKWLAQEFLENYGLQVTIDDDKEAKPLRYEVRSTVFQVVRELLYNITKHAETSRARISLLKIAQRMVITVQDEGRGFDVAATLYAGHEPRGYGLYTIREKIQYFGGQMAFDSAPGQGTRVTITVPVEPPEQK